MRKGTEPGTADSERKPKRPMITLEKVLSICARPSKDQNVSAYSTSTIPNELHARSPMTYIGSSDESARTNIIGACTTHDATAAEVCPGDRTSR